MPKFKVYLRATSSFEVEVECEDRAYAGQLAREIWCQSENPDEDFPLLSNDLDVDSVDEI